MLHVYKIVGLYGRENKLIQFTIFWPLLNFYFLKEGMAMLKRLLRLNKPLGFRVHKMYTDALKYRRVLRIQGT